MLEQETSIINKVNTCSVKCSQLSHNFLDTVLLSDSNDWPKMISFSEKKKIIAELRKFFNADSLTCQQMFLLWRRST